MNFIDDIELKNSDDTYNIIIEICPNTNNKDELVSPTFDRLYTVRKVIGLYPFYYGSFPQTLAGDRDPLDFILFTDTEHKQLDIVKVDVIGAIHTVDQGDIDDKIICVEHNVKIKKLKKKFKMALKFLFKYKGSVCNTVIQRVPMSISDSEEIIAESHNAYLSQKSKQRYKANKFQIHTNS